jgi:hypothetical protein
MAKPRPLYVSRPLLNAEAVREWARSAGFTSALAADEMHVTVAFSRKPVDWQAIPPDTRPLTIELTHDGDQRVKTLGSATVLRFTAPALEKRWRAFRAAGASWDFPSYQPHVTITYKPPGRWPTPPDRMQPYHGPLRFGPERYAALDEDWKGGVQESPLAKALPPAVLLLIGPRRVVTA